MESKIILAADGMNFAECVNLVLAIGERLYAVKIHDLYDWYGPTVVQTLLNMGAPRVWVDAKLHDIPNTVRLRTKALVASGAEIVSVHASGGVEMMRAAVEAAGEKAEIYAVTVLTSLSVAEVMDTYGTAPDHAVCSLAVTAKKAEVQGIVCSPREVSVLADISDFQSMKLVVPGIRSDGKDTGDQKRVDTPYAAICAGADYLVIGRQVTQAPDPKAALKEIEDEIAPAFEELWGGREGK